MNKRFCVYPNGFLFSDEAATDIPLHYQFMKIINTFNYYFDERSEPQIFEDNKNFIIIHGHFVHVGLNGQLNNSQLLESLLDSYRNNYELFLETLDFVGGRYAVIIGNQENVEVYQDASGTRSVYYCTDSNAVSSHVHLLTDNYECESNKLVEEVEALKNFSVYTPFENIWSMIPNFSLDFHSKNIKRFFPRSDNKYAALTEKEKFHIIEKCWKDQFKYFGHKYDTITHSISGGFDSRVSLALTKDFMNKLDFYTYTPTVKKVRSEKKFHKVLNDDKVIVKQMLEDVPMKHEFFYFTDKKLPLNDEVENILSRNTINQHGWALIPYYLEKYSTADTLHIRNNVTAICKSPYIVGDIKSSTQEIKKRMMVSLKVAQKEVDKKQIELLIDQEINRLGYDKNLYDFEALDLYYLEIRLGRWHAEILNETDLAYETANPFNVRAIIESSLSFPVEQRKTNYVSTELINRNYPILNFYGKNTALNMYEQSKRMADKPILTYRNEQRIIKEFSVYNNSKDEIEKMLSENNTIYIPTNLLEKDFYSETEFQFMRSKGIVQIDIHSEYGAAKGKGYLQYEVYKNGRLLLKEDVADWKVTNNINIMNLVNGDTIKIRVKALRTCKSESWEAASVINIKKYNDVYLNKISDAEISCTSPYSILSEKHLT